VIGFYLTTHNTHKRQIFMHPAGFEPTIPVSEQLHTHALDLPSTGMGIFLLLTIDFIVGLFYYIISVYFWRA
jgi:hypothetical protein